MKRKIASFISGILLLASCSVNKSLSDANSSFARKEYFAASEKYRVLHSKLKDRNQKGQLYFHLAQCYAQLGDYSKATIWGRNAIRAGNKSDSAILLLADALRGADKPDESKPLYEQVLRTYPQNKKAINGIESIKRIQEMKEQPELYLVENQKTINTNSNDLITQIHPEKNNLLYLSSAPERIPEKKTNPRSGKKYAGIFTSVYDSTLQKWATPELLNDPELNSSEEEAALALAPDGNLIVFERLLARPNQASVSRLFMIRKTNASWSKPVPVAFTADGADYSGPMISNDGKTLWFASNRTGGHGGYDIWFAPISSAGEIAEPVNAGTTINSPGNELYPFLKAENTLYFSSDFHPGIGGYDIFKATKTNEKWAVEHLPSPVNSAGDDVSIRFSGEIEKGYFSSNRKGSKSMDVYSFYLPPKLFQCFGKIRNSETDSILNNVNIRIVGSDGSSQRVRSVNGSFQATLKAETEYAIVAFADGYLNAQAKLSTIGLKQAQEFELAIQAVPTNRPILIDNINYESGKWELTTESKNSLEKVISLLKLNPEAVIEIASHTDDKGDDTFNLELSGKRASAVTAYLVERGIKAQNLKAKGYGKSSPLTVNQKIAQKYGFLKTGQRLEPQTVANLKNENEKETARSLNRRTEFKVIRTGVSEF